MALGEYNNFSVSQQSIFSSLWSKSHFGMIRLLDTAFYASNFAIKHCNHLLGCFVW